MTETSKEISLGQVYQQILLVIKFLLSKWKLLLLTGIVGAGIGLAIAFTSKKVYFGELVFAFEEKSNSLGSYAAIASQFGLDMGGGGAGTFSGDNLVELLKSRLMIERALTTPVVIDGDTVCSSIVTSTLLK